MRKTLAGHQQIEEALKKSFVKCRVYRLDPRREFVVRDVRREDGMLEVLLLEGWRQPDEVWMEVSGERAAGQQS